MEQLQYAVVADAYEKIEATTKRLEMTDLLVDLLKKTPKNVIDKVVYLTQGKLYPDFAGVEIGVAEKLALKAIAKASGRKDAELLQLLATVGDIGEVAEKVLKKKTQTTFGLQRNLTALEVYETLDKVANKTGPFRSACAP